MAYMEASGGDGKESCCIDKERRKAHIIEVVDGGLIRGWFVVDDKGSLVEAW